MHANASYKESKELVQRVMSLYGTERNELESDCNALLGSIELDEAQFPQATDFFNKALALAKEANDRAKVCHHLLCSASFR